MKKKKGSEKKCQVSFEDKGELICHLIKAEDGADWEFNTSNSKCKNKILNEVLKEIKDNYRVRGVWSMFAKKNQQEWVCVQVAQKHNSDLEKHSIGCEIAEDLEIMFCKEHLICNECDNVVKEDRLFYKNVYERHKCENCKKTYDGRAAFRIRFKANNRLKSMISIRSLARRFDIYHDIATKYQEIAIFCVKVTKADEPRNKTLSKEREYAERYKAIYFH
jgi:hypothetical protein